MMGSPVVVFEMLAAGAEVEVTAAVAAAARSAPRATANDQTRRPCSPSLNSTSSSSLVVGVGVERSRPATYPPRPKLARVAKITYSPVRIASAIEASRHDGDEEARASPSEEPKVNNTNESAEAARAPAMIGVHSTYRNGLSARPARTLGASMAVSPVQRRPKNDRIARTTTISPTR